MEWQSISGTADLAARDKGKPADTSPDKDIGFAKLDGGLLVVR
jgi:hypothetical protein